MNIDIVVNLNVNATVDGDLITSFSLGRYQLHAQLEQLEGIVVMLASAAVAMFRSRSTQSGWHCG